VLAVLAVTALAQDTSPPAGWEDRRRDGAELYETGMYTGLGGLGAVLFGTTAAFTIVGFDGSSDNEIGLGLAIAAAVAGAVAIEVGAPLALAGSRQERTAMKRLGLAPATGGTTAADVGWAMYAGQIVLAPLFLGAYACAYGQHASNQGVELRAATVPAIGVRATF
jgi:hypothetical protein